MFISKVTQSTTINKNNYELVYTQPGNNYDSFCVVVPTADKNNFINIIKEFKAKYTKDSLSTGFQIAFFLPSNKSEASQGDCTNAKAIFHENYNTNLSELDINDTNETIKVK
jgi:hypothetical protein